MKGNNEKASSHVNAKRSGKGLVSSSMSRPMLPVNPLLFIAFPCLSVSVHVLMPHSIFFVLLSSFTFHPCLLLCLSLTSLFPSLLPFLRIPPSFIFTPPHHLSLLPLICLSASFNYNSSFHFSLSLPNHSSLILVFFSSLTLSPFLVLFPPLLTFPFPFFHSPTPPSPL